MRNMQGEVSSELLVQIISNRMQYKPGERDMLLIKHDFTIEYSDRREFVTCTLIDYGIKNGKWIFHNILIILGDSSMSRTVSFPVAIAIRLVLEGKFNLTGMLQLGNCAYSIGLQIPTIPELYNPILDELESLGIKFVDKVERVEKK